MPPVLKVGELSPVPPAPTPMAWSYFRHPEMAAPLKLRPYGAIEIRLLLLLIFRKY